MCAESGVVACHRRLITDYMLTRGWEVIHLMRRGSGRTAA
jgi:uncharacterized protein (DUF488 family)